MVASDGGFVTSLDVTAEARQVFRERTKLTSAYLPINKIRPALTRVQRSEERLNPKCYNYNIFGEDDFEVSHRDGTLLIPGGFTVIYGRSFVAIGFAT